MNIFHQMMLSLSATNTLLVSVIAFSYADLFSIIALMQWVVNGQPVFYAAPVHSLQQFSALRLRDINTATVALLWTEAEGSDLRIRINLQIQMAGHGVLF